jgi:multidrug resistance efflux pump
MSTSTADLLFDRFAATAATVVEARPQVDPAMIREIFDDAATMLHNGLALDHLDDHDARIVVAELCAALTEADPTTALMTRFYAATEEPADLHDPIGVALAYENVLGILQL